jgi:hypothetical protein
VSRALRLAFAAGLLAGCGDASLSSTGVGKANDAGVDARATLVADAGGDLGRDPMQTDAATTQTPPDAGVADADDDGAANSPPDADATTGPPTPDAAAIPPTSPPTAPPTEPPPPPPLPAIRPNGFHTIVIADTDRWDSIRALADADLGPILVSDNKPADLPLERWTRRISASREDSGEALAALVAAELGNPAGAPIKVVVDELREEYADKILAMTREMAARYPQWRGRWGVYIVNGPAVHYAGYTAQIDALLDAGAMILAEMYPQAADYCAAGPRVIDRDLWMARFFRGDENIARLHWLVNRKADRGSDSHVSVVFGVIDRFHAPVTPAIFLDRMFYVFVTRSDHRELIDPANGGPGAWKWQAPADGNDNVTNSSRDLAFAEAFDHYLVQGRNDSRLGQVDCP